MTDIQVIRNEAQRNEQQRQKNSEALSNLDIDFPIKTLCSACECGFAIPDLALLECVWNKAKQEWAVGFCCPICYTTNPVFKDADYLEYHNHDRKGIYSTNHFEYAKKRSALNRLIDMYKKTPRWLKIFRWVRHIDWKINNARQQRKNRVYLNDERFRVDSKSITMIPFQKEDVETRMIETEST